jgi:hypothetical protein
MRPRRDDRSTIIVNAIARRKLKYEYECYLAISTCTDTGTRTHYTHTGRYMLHAFQFLSRESKSRTPKALKMARRLPKPAVERIRQHRKRQFASDISLLFLSSMI